MFERFTPAARAAVVRAQENARQLRQEEIRTEHLLLALVQDPTLPGRAALRRLGVTERAAREELTLLDSPGGPLAQEDAAALASLGIDVEEVRRRAEQSFGAGALEEPAPRRGRTGLLRRRRRPGTGHLPFTREAKQALECSLREAVRRGDRSIGSEHLLLGLLDEADRRTAALLGRFGTDPATLRAQILEDLAAKAD
ncbi:peptidase [Streptomyces sp. XM4193]|uniref:Clp protease N-terminal domain-containing protein n=1 Tax=Streptomyces sp. XM4193 TaxID=2929782 RepID=UPI001FFBDDB3|nr:Clp protease N-terminal domain-containing protein [Streptomyces sp. XM4193]MCK1797213.1 peptidase [Streptomyces sp. XM4193]